MILRFLDILAQVKVRYTHRLTEQWRLLGVRDHCPNITDVEVLFRRKHRQYPKSGDRIIPCFRDIRRG